MDQDIRDALNRQNEEIQKLRQLVKPAIRELEDVKSQVRAWADAPPWRGAEAAKSKPSLSSGHMTELSTRFGLNVQNASTLDAATKHITVLKGIPDEGNLKAARDLMVPGKSYNPVELAARMVSTPPEAAAYLYFLKKRGFVEFKGKGHFRCEA